MVEEWRAIDGFPDYEVSSLGRVKRARPDRYGRWMGKIISPINLRAGYLQCSLSSVGGRKKLLVHRLVCAAFNGPAPTDQHHAAHKDGMPSNNLPENLRWATASENEADKRAHGTLRFGATHHSATKPERAARGSRVGTSKLTEAMVVSIRADARPRMEIAKAYGLCKSHVSEIRSGKVWKHVPMPHNSGGL